MYGGKLMYKNILLEVQGITKHFPGVKALDDVNLSVIKAL